MTAHGLIAILSLVPLLASCGLLSAAPTRQIYRTDPSFAFAAPLPHVATQLVVALPSAPAGLDTERIALSRAPVSLDYFADAQWTDRVPFLLQTALVDGFEKSAAIPAVGPESLGVRGDFVLETAIGDFEAIYDSPDGAPRVVVRVNTKLVRLPERRIVAQMSVSREAKAAANALPEIVRAFDQALGGAVAEIVGWTLGNRALSERRG
jgi:cholesterol transport system auxiliary component